MTLQKKIINDKEYYSLIAAGLESLTKIWMRIMSPEEIPFFMKKYSLSADDLSKGSETLPKIERRDPMLTKIELDMAIADKVAKRKIAVGSIIEIIRYNKYKNSYEQYYRIVVN